MSELTLEFIQKRIEEQKTELRRLYDLPSTDIGISRKIELMESAKGILDYWEDHLPPPSLGMLKAMDQMGLLPIPDFWEWQINQLKFGQPLIEAIDSGYFDIGPKVFRDHELMVAGAAYRQELNNVMTQK